MDRLMKIDSPISRFIRDAMEVYFEASFLLGYEGSSLHDPLTLATIIALQLLTTERILCGCRYLRRCFHGQDVCRCDECAKKTGEHEGSDGCTREEFVELFLQRMETLSRKIGD